MEQNLKPHKLVCYTGATKESRLWNRKCLLTEASLKIPPLLSWYALRHCCSIAVGILLLKRNPHWHGVYLKTNSVHSTSNISQIGGVSRRPAVSFGSVLRYCENIADISCLMYIWGAGYKSLPLLSPRRCPQTASKVLIQMVNSVSMYSVKLMVKSSL